MFGWLRCLLGDHAWRGVAAYRDRMIDECRRCKTRKTIYYDQM